MLVGAFVSKQRCARRALVGIARVVQVVIANQCQAIQRNLPASRISKNRLVAVGSDVVKRHPMGRNYHVSATELVVANEWRSAT